VLPLGLAALFAFCCSIAVIVPCMNQVRSSLHLVFCVSCRTSWFFERTMLLPARFVSYGRCRIWPCCTCFCAVVILGLLSMLQLGMKAVQRTVASLSVSRPAPRCSPSAPRPRIFSVRCAYIYCAAGVLRRPRRSRRCGRHRRLHRLCGRRARVCPRSHARDAARGAVGTRRGGEN
jgi:hypothetical protein